ncbi:MAG: NADH-quinone oxidoreductase subunit C [Candidatus Micrarchaeia archaeon]
MKVEREKLLDTIKNAKDSGLNYLIKITAVDYGDHEEVIYFLMDLEKNKEENIRVDIKSGDLWIPTIIDILKSADWYEREMSEMFGIDIRGREMKRLLLEKWDGVDAPMKKGFAWGEKYKSSE